MMPAKEPQVLHRPNIWPACRGAISDMFATNPAWPARKFEPSENPDIVSICLSVTVHPAHCQASKLQSGSTAGHYPGLEVNLC